jgi:hypothetical protein
VLIGLFNYMNISGILELVYEVVSNFDVGRGRAHYPYVAVLMGAGSFAPEPGCG